MEEPIVVIGAGLSGLACARTLADAGRPVRVLERSRGVGGRCATRRVEEQPVDHGPSFLHGSDPRFLAAARQASSRLVERWPQRVRGHGAPCHPSSFREGELQFVYPDGLRALPKSLASGLALQLEAAVEKLERSDGAFELSLSGGARLRCGKLVLAAALEQSVALLKPLSLSLKPLRGTLSLLESMGSLACVALLAGYPRGVDALAWDVWYPEESPVLQLLSHDSAKRQEPRFEALVLQARPRWSREHLEDSDASLRRDLLAEAARLLGPWALEPVWAQAHRWRFARTNPGCELSAPILHRFGDGFLGLAGDAFASGGGAEGAYLSGVQLAERILKS